MTPDSNQILSGRISRVREVAQSRLSQYAKLEPDECKEVYLFQDSLFCGVQFLLGPFLADWRVDETVLRFVRAGNQIDRIELDESQEQRAA